MTLGAPSVMPGQPPAIGDLVRGGDPTFSFEFFPPSPGRAGSEKTLWTALRELESLHPSFVSVTYGAGGGNRAATVETTDRIATETTMLPMAHLTAVNHSVAELRNLIGHFASVGVRNILALRGDPPGDVAGDWIAHPEGYEHAYQLVELIKESGDFSVGVAAFPERHPRSPDWDSEIRNFVAKCRAGADFAITQMFFDWRDWARLRDATEKAGCDVPIIPGVMPVVNVRNLVRIAELTGATIPAGVAARFEAVSGDAAAVRALGVEIATGLCERLLAEGAPGIHFITMNRSTATREIWQNLRSMAAV
ncbi:methylenetetrahydrofolate reductase [Actinorhabdospora filicis]|uniref:Methylenetetrahydrofolate reductase n=1 Tax=Actinorhabdospora filicis TaxID=1785913 RepID=A0A9W6SNG7_9ACTN|nr:methylenetetrahydrofolate reductase [NAD(P)H] [Actinorhabdospora filicis]GLZ78992.1 methylenetetrahydrofolate reductase [Actinorhabdospora filicis]